MYSACCLAVVAAVSGSGLRTSAESVRGLELEVAELTRKLSEASVALQQARQSTAIGLRGDAEAVPKGAYLESCKGCVMFGETLDCSCGNGAGAQVQTSIAPWASCDMPLNITNEDGFLTCDWKEDIPPPRIGNLTYFGKGSLPDIDQTCRILKDTTFFAPQYKKRGDPLASIVLTVADGLTGEAAMEDVANQCCTKCTNTTLCRAWTVDSDGSTCHMGSTASTAYPLTGATSGYPLKSDAASYCQMIWQNGGGRPWGDLHTAKGVSCTHIPARGTDGKVGSFPRKWSDVKNRQRGEAWLFSPSR